MNTNPRFIYLIFIKTNICLNHFSRTTIFTFKSLQLDIVVNFSNDKHKFRKGRRGQKGSPTSFSPVTSTNVGFGPQNFLTFSFNPFATLVQNFKFVPSASPKLLNLNQAHSSKKSDFSSQMLIKLRLC